MQKGAMVGVDSNALSYLVGALASTYDPSLDQSALNPERIAIVRIYFYKGSPYCVTPTVRAEYQRIGETISRDSHDRLCQFLLLDPWSLNQVLVDNRTSVLLANHSDPDDCSIIAEAELMGLQVLLTCDSDMTKHLRPLTSLLIMKPSDYWNSLGIQPGVQPAIVPAPSNPLSTLNWWRI
jgi:hypothetical protein